MEGYCLKDKKKVEMKDPKPITMKNGKPATVGTCPFCGTKIYRIDKSTEATVNKGPLISSGPFFISAARLLSAAPMHQAELLSQTPRHRRRAS
jgi:hypothetical protein